jgi:ATP-dependent protease HslVU (ClpYQ) peptidase subunit
MTTIIGLQGEGWSVIGADSKISSFDEQGFITSQSTLPQHTSKLIEKDGHILGAAGDVRAINLLHHVYEPPSLRYATSLEKLDKHVTKRVIPTLRRCFDEEGFSPPDKGDRDHKAEHNSTIIVSIKARIYVIENDYAWTQDRTGIYAIGTGAPFARAALHLLTGNNSTDKLNQKKAIAITEKALEIASVHDAYTGAPFHIVSQVADMA